MSDVQGRLMAFYVIWRVWCLAMWFGIMFAVLTVIIALALVCVVGAVVYGALSPTRTVRGQLRSVVANGAEAASQIQSLNPRSN